MNRSSFVRRMLVILACLVGSWAGLASAAGDQTPERVSVREVLALRQMIGRQVTVWGHVTSTGISDRSGHHFLNFDNREFSVICMAADLGKFTSGKPAERYKGQEIEVTGVLEQFRDKLQIRLSDPAQIEIVVAAPSKPTPAKPTPAPGSSPVELKKIGPDAWLSPAGLKYQGRDPDGRTRVDHVLRHARDIPDRDGSHGVFDGGPDAVFGVIDEAWRTLEKTKLRPTIEGDRSLYTVSMGRRVGYLGGRAGASRGHPPLTRIFLVIETGTKNVITAFPR